MTNIIFSFESLGVYIKVLVEGLNGRKWITVVWVVLVGTYIYFLVIIIHGV